MSCAKLEVVHLSHAITEAESLMELDIEGEGEFDSEHLLSAGEIPLTEWQRGYFFEWLSNKRVPRRDVPT